MPRNVAKAAKPPALGRQERRALTAEKARALLAALTDDRLESLFVLALTTGLRRAELLGLRWADVDLECRALFVRQTLQRTDAGLIFVPPKTHRRPGLSRCQRWPRERSRSSALGRPRNVWPLGSCGLIMISSSPARSAHRWSRGT